MHMRLNFLILKECFRLKARDIDKKKKELEEKKKRTDRQMKVIGKSVKQIEFYKKG